MYKKDELSNSIRVVTHDIKDRDSIALGFWVGVGGRHEDDRVKGAAHFIEHIVFKGSRKYSCEGIKEKIEGVGGALNAFTSEEQTCFYARIPAKHLEQTFDVLADMVFFPKMQAADIVKEKTVIIEEIKMYHDLPQYYVLELLDQLTWPNHPLGKSLAGTPESIRAMKNGDLKSFHQHSYIPRNIVVAACGNLNHKRIVNLVNKKLGNIKKDDDVRFQKAANIQSSPGFKFVHKDIEQMHLAIGMLGLDTHHNDRYVLSLLSIILGGNMSSRLFSEVREKRGLAYSISSCCKALDDTGQFMIRAGVDNTKITDTVRLILKEFEKIKKTGVHPSEFSRAKDYFLGQMLLGLEDTMEHMLWLGECILSKNKFRRLNKIVKEVEGIKLGDIKRVANDILKKNHYNLAIVGPVTSKQKKELQGLV